MGRHIAQSRLDPIVSPRKVSGHLHTVIGGSAFSRDYSFEAYKSAACSTAEVLTRATTGSHPLLLLQPRRLKLSPMDRECSSETPAQQLHLQRILDTRASKEVLEKGQKSTSRDSPPTSAKIS
ncbi:hypothetical protein DFH27DRAFT_621950 [Peziza echinospora]|nr:hypothetical protein DFH27DRAFT_621950 [Peziza echinospora]